MNRVVVLISGRGSNMQALLEAGLPVVAVVSNRPDAKGLTVAQERGVPTDVVDHRHFPDRESFDAALLDRVLSYGPDLIVLAGFMRVLTSRFVAPLAGRLMNIHPSLLPAFPGLGTHARALQEGVKIHGCTVHFVTPQLDHGPIIVQAAIPVLPHDTEETLAVRVLQQEHRIFPEAVRWFMEDRIQLIANRVVIADSCTDETTLFSPGIS